jgi:hypothetical protein
MPSLTLRRRGTAVPGRGITNLSPTCHETPIPRCSTCAGIPRGAARSAIGTANDAGIRLDADPGDATFVKE